MSALVIDTSSWSAYFRGSLGEQVEEALAAGRVYLPVVVAAELLSARLSGRRRTELQDFLRDLPACGIDREHWFRVGTLRSRLLGKGLSVSTPDAHIAQCTLDLNAELLSADHVFKLVARHVPLRLA